MELQNVASLGPSGYTLSIEEKSALQVSMLAIQRKENLPNKLMFWGKIMGETNDYLIAYSLIPAYYFPVKRFYYCTTANMSTLVQMPILSPEWKELSAAIKLPFRGEPSALMIEGAEEPEEPEVAEGEEPPPPVEVFREQHRLSYVVSQIDHDVAVVPRGAFIVDAAHKVTKNKFFEGLSYPAAGSLANYYHFRAPESARAAACLEKPGIVRPADFLDPVAEDAPAGVWSQFYDSSSSMSLLRSFYWPGYFFYHVCETGDYGGVYIGDGLANEDLPFML